MGRRILNDALRTMVNAERRGFATAKLQPISGVMISFLNIMKHRGNNTTLHSLSSACCCGNPPRPSHLSISPVTPQQERGFHPWCSS
jgi:hypothetical protein